MTTLPTKPNEQLPAYLQGQPADGHDQLSSYQQLSFIKTIQSTVTDQTLLDDFGVGAVVMMPERVLVAASEAPFTANTLYFWPSYEQWRDLKDKSGGPIEAQTLDANSDIGKKCKVPRYSEPYPNDPQMVYKFTTCLNFLVQIEDGEAKGMRGVLPFRRGGIATGNRLRGYLLRRGGPIWSNVVTFATGPQKNRDGQRWHQVDFTDARFVEETRCDELSELYDEAKRSHEAMMIGMADTGDAQ